MSRYDEREETVFLVRAIETQYRNLTRGGVLTRTPFGDSEGEIFFPPHECHADAPSIRECRFAALQIGNDGYVVYDRLLSRIVDGVYYGGDIALHNALGVAELYNDGSGNPDMSPNGDALGLQYPKGGKRKEDK